MGKGYTQNNSYYQIKPVFEKVLCVLFGILAGFHLLFTMSIYVMGTQNYLTSLKVDRYLALIAVAALIAYVILMTTRYRLFAKKEVVAHVKNVFTGANLWLTILFVWYLVGCTVWCASMGGQIFTMNDRFLLDVFISFFVLYMFPWDRKVLDWFIHVLMLVNTVFMVWVLYNNFKLNILTVPGGQIGMTETYSLVIACNRNTTGAFAAVFLMLALFMISTKKGVVRALYIVAAVIQLFPLYLSNSRTPYIACTAVLALAGFFMTYRKYTGKYRIPLSLGVGLLCGAGFYFLRYGVIGIYDGVTHLSEQLGTSLSDAVRDSDLTNTSGRMGYWKASLQAIVLSNQTFMVGVTPARVEEILGYVRNIENNAGYTHNQFLQMAVAFGVPVLAMYCVWLAKLAKQCWQVAFKGRYWMLSCMVLMLVLSNLMESYLVAYFYFCGGVFFLVCGMVKVEADELAVPVQNIPQKTADRKKKAASGKKKKK